MATHPSILAWEIPWTEVAGGLQALGSQSIRTELLTLPGLCPRPALLFLDCSSLVSAFLPFPN